MSLKIVIFYGSVRSERQGIKAARFIVSKKGVRNLFSATVRGDEIRHRNAKKVPDTFFTFFTSQAPSLDLLPAIP